MKNSKRLKFAPIVTPDKRKQDEEYRRKLNESVNYIGEQYVRAEISYYRSRIGKDVDGSLLGTLEHVARRLEDGNLSGGQAHKLINRILYEQQRNPISNQPNTEQESKRTDLTSDSGTQGGNGGHEGQGD